MAKQIGTLGNIDTLAVGGRVFVDVSTTTSAGSLIILFGSLGGTTNIYSGLFKMGSQTASAYQVTTGKTYRVAVVKGIARAAVAESLFGPGQADNALGLATSSTPTNPIYFGSEGSSASHNMFSVANTVGSTVEMPCYGSIASQKYGFFKSGGNASSDLACFTYGYEF